MTACLSDTEKKFQESSKEPRRSEHALFIFYTPRMIHDHQTPEHQRYANKKPPHTRQYQRKNNPRPVPD
jgi:hypothetical protein